MLSYLLELSIGSHIVCVKIPCYFWEICSHSRFLDVQTIFLPPLLWCSLSFRYRNCVEDLSTIAGLTMIIWLVWIFSGSCWTPIDLSGLKTKFLKSWNWLIRWHVIVILLLYASPSPLYWGRRFWKERLLNRHPWLLTSRTKAVTMVSQLNPLICLVFWIKLFLNTMLPNNLHII